ncbi:MAG: DUF5908 family protein [Flavobacterium sp.]|nr:DUF5908 family protein [Flavobacterium sp.]
MPIEIKELHIKINVEEQASKTTTAKSADESTIMKAVGESIEQAMNIEKRKKER